MVHVGFPTGHFLGWAKDTGLLQPSVNLLVVPEGHVVVVNGQRTGFDPEEQGGWVALDGQSIALLCPSNGRPRPESTEGA